jgi:hypothetical protein
MTNEQVEAVLRRAQSWPQSRREDAAQLLLALEAQGTEPYVLSEGERAEIELALDEVSRGEIASDAEVAAVFARHRG